MLVSSIKIIVEKHDDGYIAYPVGMRGVVIGEGDTYAEALADVARRFSFTSRRSVRKHRQECLCHKTTALDSDALSFPEAASRVAQTLLSVPANPYRTIVSSRRGPVEMIVAAHSTSSSMKRT